MFSEVKPIISTDPNIGEILVRINPYILTDSI